MKNFDVKGAIIGSKRNIGPPKTKRSSHAIDHAISSKLIKRTLFYSTNCRAEVAVKVVVVVLVAVKVGRTFTVVAVKVVLGANSHAQSDAMTVGIS